MAALFCGTHGSVAMAGACSIAPLAFRTRIGRPLLLVSFAHGI